MDLDFSGNFFEDFSLGQRIWHRGGRTVSSADNSLYISLTGDRFPTYCDAAFAQSLGYERELIHDLLVFHIVFGKTVPEISMNAVANLGYADVQFLRPVYAGDTLHASTEIIGLKENSSGLNGNVYVRTVGTNQHNEPVLSYIRWVMIHKRDKLSTSREPQIPLVESVTRPVSTMPRQDTQDWVEGAFWEDYTTDDWMYDGAGMTIEQSEHAMATRLYQNTAKVHFDAKAMGESPAGKRLVYGGHVISLAHALAYPFLPNAARIVAWNSGIHANPTHAGDTLYAAARVIERKDIFERDDLGLLRVHLVCLKNCKPDADKLVLQITEGGRSKYASHVVLDLDYWLAIARKRSL